MRFTVDGTTVHLVQLVSSGLKHSGTISKRLLGLLGRLNRRHHQRIGWAAAPRARHAGRVARGLLGRPANTDTWVEDAPVFVSPAVARKLRIDRPPDYREVRTYLTPDGPSGSPLIGENNIGLVTVDGHTVTHRLLSRHLGTTTHQTRVDLADSP